MVIQEHAGRLQLSYFPEAAFWQSYDFRARLFGLPEPVVIDHIALTLANEDALNCYVDALRDAGAAVSEGPAIWPDAFCLGREFPEDLKMHFVAAIAAAGGTVVVAAPHCRHDQLDRFRQERGALAVHHVAALVNDPVSALSLWQKHGFEPRTPLLDDGDLVQQFLGNDHGQLVELIHRRGAAGNFSCNNLGRLRAAEA